MVSIFDESGEISSSTTFAVVVKALFTAIEPFMIAFGIETNEEDVEQLGDSARLLEVLVVITLKSHAFLPTVIKFCKIIKS